MDKKTLCFKNKIGKDPAAVEMKEIHQMLRKHIWIGIKPVQVKNDKTTVQNKQINKQIDRKQFFFERFHNKPFRRLENLIQYYIIEF